MRFKIISEYYKYKSWLVMNNNNALEFFSKMTTIAKNDPKCVKISKVNDYTSTDAQFILKYANKNSEILDLGSGTGLIVNKIFNCVKSIDCVEPFKAFSDHIIKNKNVSVNNINLLEFKTDKKYDLISIFGLIQYFNLEETKEIYNNCLKWLKKGGKIIIKNQFGIYDDVLVEGYSEEQKTDYFSQYRHIKKEIELLKNIGFKNIETFDIYPPEANRWNNTHFYAIVGEKQ